MSDFPLEKFTEPITKLIETIKEGITILYEPTRITRKAKADIKAAKMIAKAKVEILAIEDISVKNYYLALEQEKLLLEFQEKANRDNIVSQAAQQLKNKTVSKEKVDSDWTKRFFSYAEKISNHEVQILWAKLLAGEVESPGKFSKRALSILASMSLIEAKAFHAIASHSFIKVNGDAIFPVKKYDKSNLFYDERKVEILKIINLIFTSEKFPHYMRYSKKQSENYIWLTHHDYGIKVTFEDKSCSSFYIKGHRLTHVGKELIQLVSADNDVSNHLYNVFSDIVWHDANYATGGGQGQNLITVEYGKQQDFNKNTHSFKNSKTISWKDFCSEKEVNRYLMSSRYK